MVTPHMFGRQTILTAHSEITPENVVEVLQSAMVTHAANRAQIEYLWNYYKGRQPILDRVKEVRPEICNKIVENRANEIVSFKVGYLCGEPIQYVSRNGGTEVANAVKTLNEMMFAESKASKDRKLVEWQMIAGTAYRLVLPNRFPTEDDAPFEIFTLDPRDSFVVYSNDVGNKPLMGVKYKVDEMGNTVASIYTKACYFEVSNGAVTKVEAHALGMIPIIEYPGNTARLGAFEIVLPLLDELNNMASNRMDAMEQFIQAFVKFINCDISAEDFRELKEMGAIKVKSVDGQAADVDIVSNELNQDQAQTSKDDAYQAVLTICGMPNRNGGTSTSDTGQAVLLRDGWSLAESRAKDSELMFKESEQEMLKLVLRICRDLAGLNLKLKDIDMKFTRRNYEAIQSKSQVLVSMLQQPKIHPLLAFTHCGMFSDPESAYALSDAYYQDVLASAAEQKSTGNPDDDKNPEGTGKQTQAGSDKT